MPAPWAASARSPLGSAPPNSNMSWPPRCWRPGGRSACASGSMAGSAIRSAPRTWRCASSPKSVSRRPQPCGGLRRRGGAGNADREPADVVQPHDRNGFAHRPRRPRYTTFAWIAGRPWAPKGAMWETALDVWRTLASDDDVNSKMTSPSIAIILSLKSPGAPIRARPSRLPGACPTRTAPRRPSCCDPARA